MHRLVGVTESRSMAMHKIFALKKLALASILLCVTFATTAQAGTELERKVKAAFVYNFAKFIEWPKDNVSPDNRFVICVAGETLLGDALGTNLENKVIKDHIIHVRNIGWSVNKLNDCQMLYLNGTGSPRIGPLLKAASEKPILTIGESNDFIANGGIIQFLLIEGKVRFSINQASAIRAGLNISAKLLEVSYRVAGQQSSKLDQGYFNRHVKI